MEHTFWELGMDVLVLSEIPRGPPDSQRWVSSSDAKAAVALTVTAMMAVTDSGGGPGFAFMLFPGLLVFSCYWRLGGPLHEFEGFLSGLEASLRTHGAEEQDIIVTGDFNAKSRAWSSSVDDARLLRAINVCLLVRAFPRRFSRGYYLTEWWSGSRAAWPSASLAFAKEEAQLRPWKRSWELLRRRPRGVRDRHLFLLVTLDVQNAFNMAPWQLIDVAVARFELPLYFRELVRS